MNGPLRTYHHGNLRAEILDRAAQIIESEGIEALSLRGIARDLGVSHAAPNRHFKNKAALLSDLATESWLSAREATLAAADNATSQDPRSRLHAMGCGYMRWALYNRALYRSMRHPDVVRFASADLQQAIDEFNGLIKAEIQACQLKGHHAEVPVEVLSIYTTSVPMGAANLLIDPLMRPDGLRPEHQRSEQEIERLIQQVIDLVVPPA